jgi:hypothetical protein
MPSICNEVHGQSTASNEGAGFRIHMCTVNAAGQDIGTVVKSEVAVARSKTRRVSFSFASLSAFAGHQQSLLAGTDKQMSSDGDGSSPRSVVNIDGEVLPLTTATKLKPVPDDNPLLDGLEMHWDTYMRVSSTSKATHLRVMLVAAVDQSVVSDHIVPLNEVLSFLPTTHSPIAHSPKKRQQVAGTTGGNDDDAAISEAGTDSASEDYMSDMSSDADAKDDADLWSSLPLNRRQSKSNIETSMRAPNEALRVPLPFIKEHAPYNQGHNARSVGTGSGAGWLELMPLHHVSEMSSDTSPVATTANGAAGAAAPALVRRRVNLANRTSFAGAQVQSDAETQQLGKMTVVAETYCHLIRIPAAHIRTLVNEHRAATLPLKTKARVSPEFGTSARNWSRRSTAVLNCVQNDNANASDDTSSDSNTDSDSDNCSDDCTEILGMGSDFTGRKGSYARLRKGSTESAQSSHGSKLSRFKRTLRRASTASARLRGKTTPT